MYHNPLTTRANYIFFAVLHFNCIVAMLLATTADAQSSATAQITVSVTVGAARSASIYQDWIDDFFGSIDPDYEVTPNSDYDKDGQLDYFEYYAGTDPTSGASGLQIVETVLSGDDAIIKWSSVPDKIPPESPGNRFYRLFRCGPDALASLADPNATIPSLQFNTSITDLGDIASQGETTSYTDRGVADRFPLFYRVFLSKPETRLPSP